MTFIEVQDDFGRKYINVGLLNTSKYLYYEKSHWNDSDLWYVRFQHDSVELIFASEERAIGCYEYLKAFLMD